jgi:Flp pilus assembly protein protease CpaA
MYEFFLIVLALLWLTGAAIFDFRSREIPDWLSFSLIAFALAYRAFVSIFTSDWSFLVSGVAGFAVFWILGNVMYRIGFGGGDAKILMAMGTVIPFSFSYAENIKIMAIFIFALLFIGAIYSLIYSIGIALFKFGKFKRMFKARSIEHKNLVLGLFALAIIPFVLVFFNIIFLPLALLMLIFPILFVYAKAVEDVMIKKLSGRELTIGDWLAEKVKVGRHVIEPRPTGLNEHDLRLLRKYHKTILIKDGIPFTISFLLAFIAFIWLWQSGWSFFNYNFGF